MLYLILAGFIAAASYMNSRFAVAKAQNLRQGGRAALSSVPGYYGLYALLWCAVPALLLLLGFAMAEDQIWHSLTLQLLPPEATASGPGRLQFYLSDLKILSKGGALSRTPEPWLLQTANELRHWRDMGRAAFAALMIALVCGGGLYGYRSIHGKLRASETVDRAVLLALQCAAGFAVLITFGIVLSLLFEAMRFFGRVPPLEFLFGLHWSPQASLQAGQGGFGAVPAFAGTLLITALALLVAVPIGLMSAIFLVEYAKPKTRAWLKPALELLAGVPTVVYGFFASLLIGPALRAWGDALGIPVAAESALAAGMVMGVMLIPFISSLSDDVLHSVPQSLHDGSLAMGATPSETIKRVVIPAALPGIVGACLLALSRAIGETMIVVMAAGLIAHLTLNPLSSVTTVTVQIVMLLVGDQEFASTTTLAAFALGLMLFLVTLGINAFALSIVRRYRERYE